MKIGRLHVRFRAGRQEHTQFRYPDAKWWQTSYMESDEDCDDVTDAQDEWTADHGGISVRHRVVTRRLIKFEIHYRSFFLEVGNCSRWKPRSSHEQSKQGSTQLPASW